MTGGLMKIFGGLGLAVIGVAISLASISEDGSYTLFYGLIVVGVFTVIGGIIDCVSD